MERDGIAAGLVRWGKLVDAVANGPQGAVADIVTAGEFEGHPQRVVGLNGCIDGYQREGGRTGIVLSAANHHQRRCDQCQEYSGYQKGGELHETDLILTNLPNFVEKGLILRGPIGLF